MKTKKRLKEFEILIGKMGSEDALKKINEEIINQEKIVEKYKNSKQVSKYEDILDELRYLKGDYEFLISVDEGE